MRRSLQALCAAALAVPFIASPASAKFERTGVAPSVAAQPSNGIMLVQAGPRAGGGVRGGGGGFRGGYRGGFRGGYRGGFRGGVFIGPSLGFYDPFYWPYSYPYGYYAPPVVVRERAYDVPPPDYLPDPQGPAPEQSWYHCSNPDGFYPYVRSCQGQWEAVPVNPGPPPPPER